MLSLFINTQFTTASYSSRDSRPHWLSTEIPNANSLQVAMVTLCTALRDSWFENELTPQGNDNVPSQIGMASFTNVSFCAYNQAMVLLSLRTAGDLSISMEDVDCDNDI